MQITEILLPIISGFGFELVEVEFTPQKILRIFIDKQNGVTISDCEKLSQHLSNVFLVENIDYNRLEISSPGLERPLKNLEDFIKNIGKLAKIKTYEALMAQKVFQGIIKNVDNQKICLEISDNQIIEIVFENINKARLVYEIPKKSSRRNYKKNIVGSKHE